MYRRNVEINAAVAALSALGHGGRLAAFRRLVEAGPDGLAAGVLARQLGIAANTLSASLAILSHAGLVTSHRHGRSIVYAADFGAMTTLLGWLMADCCQGAPEVCRPLAGIVAEAARCGRAASAAEAPPGAGRA